MFAKSKLDSIENLVSCALIDMGISHNKFNVIIREKHKYDRMKKCEECQWKQENWGWIVWVQEK